MSDRPLRIAAYAHTHWDREWWAPFEHFRYRLVALIDRLLDILESDADFRTFVLDGQCIILRDYLEIRPENKERLVRQIREGRVRVGPWYVLADEFLVSGEAIIRNLLMGSRVAAELGIGNSMVGYLPDTFGHVAQMPQILKEFGIPTALVWRGAGGDPTEFCAEFSWESLSGSRVLALHLPAGYSSIERYGLDDAAAFERFVEDMKSLVVPHAWHDRMLLPVGCDHLPPHPDLPTRIAEYNAAHPDTPITLTGIEEYAREIAGLDSRQPVVRGELRKFGLGFAWSNVLPGVISSRMYLKRANDRCQTLLTAYAEPLALLAEQSGKAHPQAFITRAWQLLLENQAHDSICGCSIDTVHREMMTRFAKVEQIAEMIADESLAHLAAQVQLLDGDPHALQILVYNPHPWAVTDSVEVWLDGNLGVRPSGWVLRAADGEQVLFQTQTETCCLPYQRRTRENTRLTFTAHGLPGAGYKCYVLLPVDMDHMPGYLPRYLGFPELGRESQTPIGWGPHCLENSSYTVWVIPERGTLRVLDKATGQVYEDLLLLEDGADCGDLYNYSPCLNDRILTSDAADITVSFIEVGLARAVCCIQWDWTVPAGLTADRRSRSAETARLRVRACLSLHAEVPRIDVRMEIENTARDHRLRVLLPTGIVAGTCEAETQFGILPRPALSPDGYCAKETPIGTFPQQTFTRIADGERGVTVANRGLPECQLLPDARGTLALTLLRAVGWVSRDDLLTRVSPATEILAAPEGQCLGLQRAEFSLLFHTEGQKSAQIRQAYQFHAPARAVCTRSPSGSMPPEWGWIEISDEHWLLTACKRAETGDDWIVRLLNMQPVPAQAVVRFGFPVRVRMADLQENALDEEGSDAGETVQECSVAAQPWGLATLAIRPPACAKSRSSP